MSQCISYSAHVQIARAEPFAFETYLENMLLPELSPVSTAV